MNPALQSMIRKSRRVRLLALKLLADRRGVAAIEFAMLLPFMLVLFFGTVVFSSGVAANRKVSLMAQTLSDLTSRSISVASSDLTNFFAADTAIMTPYDPTFTSAILSEFYIDPTTLKPTLIWSVAYNGANASPQVQAHTKGYALPAFPSSMAVGGSYVIYSEIGYLFQPPGRGAMGLMNPNGISLNSTAYTRPRVGACVIYPTPTSGVLPPCPTTYVVLP